MLWFAAGLAFARAPVMLIAVGVAAAWAAQYQLNYGGSDWQFVAALCVILALLLGLAFWLGRWWGARSVVTGPVPLAAVLTISTATTMSLPWILRTDLNEEYYLLPV